MVQLTDDEARVAAVGLRVAQLGGLVLIVTWAARRGWLGKPRDSVPWSKVMTAAVIVVLGALAVVSLDLHFLNV